jgi:hypothetical protein
MGESVHAASQCHSAASTKTCSVRPTEKIKLEQIRLRKRRNFFAPVALGHADPGAPEKPAKR